MPEPLTQMERQVYHYLIDFLAENTYQPSIREIARRLRIKSTKTVSDLLIGLETKGYIERQSARSRGVRLLGFATATQTQPVPLYERVNHQEPALAAEHRRTFVTVDRRYLPAENVFVLRAEGHGLRERGILEGDLVLIQPGARAKDGDIVAVRAGASAEFKVVSGRSDEPILGIVCGIFRPYHEAEPAPRDEAPADDQ